MSAEPTVLEKVRAALGRTVPLTTAPIPPQISEPVTRLVHSEIGLPELFAKRAVENKMSVEAVYAEELLPKLIEFLRANACQRLGLPISKLLTQLGVVDGLRAAGFDAMTWDQLTLDAAYDLDCGITDAHYAVAETGSVVIRPSADHGRALSLVPNIHVAILEPRNFLPDLVDLFEVLGAAPRTSGTVIITGPSKTADIEGSLVTGVHGPGKVHLFILK